MIRLLHWSMIGWMFCSGAFFVVVRPLLAQSSDRNQEMVDTLRTNVAVNSSDISTLKSEVVLIRSLNIDARLVTLENTVIEVKWLGRTAASVLLGQLILAIMTNRKKVG